MTIAGANPNLADAQGLTNQPIKVHVPVSLMDSLTLLWHFHLLLSVLMPMAHPFGL
jgi:hypothetical protein